MRLLISCDLTMLYALRDSPYLRPGDVLVVAAGGRREDALEASIRYARLNFPTLAVYTSCGVKRLPEVATFASVDCVLLDWEPSTWGTASWDYPTNKKRLLGQPVQRVPLGVVVSGVPLNRRKGYRWDFRDLARSVRGPCIVMVQGFLKRSPLQRLTDRLRNNTPFEDAMSQLKGIPNVGFLLALAGDAAVSPQVAVRACKVAEDNGVGMCMVWGMDAKKTLRFLELLRG